MISLILVTGYRNGRDYFNPSTTDGFNVPVFIVPGAGCMCFFCILISLYCVIIHGPPGNTGSVGPVGCTGLNEGPGCTQTASCPTGITYEVVFCNLD